MENNPYEYRPRIAGQRPPQQPYNTIYPGMYVNQPPGAPQAFQAQQVGKRKAQTPPARMPKDRALALARLFKKALALASLATFASLSGIVAYHQANASTGQQSTTATATSTSQKANNNPFFNQQGDNHLGTSTPTATANEPTSTPTTTSGSASGPVTGFPSNPNSGSHTS